MQKPALALFAVLVATGCGPHRYLVWQAMPPAPSLMGKTAIAVTDRREQKKGGADPSVVGYQRSGFGIPFAVRIGSPGQLSMDMHDLLAQAALSAGVGVTAPGQESGATSRIVVEIQNFWCDGYWPVYKGGVAASVTIVDPTTNAVRVTGQPLVSEGQSGNCREAYKRALTTLFAGARTLFATPQIHDALVSAAPMAPPPAQ